MLASSSRVAIVVDDARIIQEFAAIRIRPHEDCCQHMSACKGSHIPRGGCSPHRAGSDARP